MKGRPTIDLTGQTFGELKAKKLIGHTKHRNAIWRCTCLACGGTTDVTSGDLRSGHTTSCGCTKGARIAKARTKHGARKRGVPASPEYVTWCAIIQRCTNENNPSYKYYGGRGIKLARSWRKFENFLADMGPRPGGNYSIERKQNHLGYNKNNCVWATFTEQANNKRSNHLVAYEGFTFTLTQLAKHKGIKQTTLRARLKRGLTVEEAVQTK